MSIKKRFKVNGFKFHQYALDALKEEVFNTVSPLHASAVAVYIGLVSEVSQAGLLPSDFKKSQLAQKLNMSRQTVNDGYNQLIDHGLIKEVTIDENVQIELFGYAMHNLDIKESSILKNKVSYFEVANELFNTSVIADLVKSKEAKGLILLLDLFNHFSRELNKNKKDPASAPDVLTMKHLKKSLGKCSAARVRNVIDMLSPLFSFVPDSISTREPVKKCSVRKLVAQIWVKKYNIYINPTCTTEKEATTVEQIESAKAIKDAHYRISAMNIALKQSDKNGIGIAYRASIREVSRFIEDVKLQKEFLRNSMQSALEELEVYAKNNNIKSIGAFINDKLQKYVFSFLDKNTSIGTDMVAYYNQTGVEEPTLWKKYKAFKSK